MSEYHTTYTLVPVRFYWLLAHPASAYYFEANAGEDS